MDILRIPRVKTTKKSTEIMENNNQGVSKETDEEFICKPKKLQNPVKESVARQNLHKELLFNQKIGKQVLNKKSELEKAVERVKNKPESSQPPPQPTDSGEFHRVLQERAKQIEENRYFVDDNSSKSEQETSEFIKIHKKIFSHLND